MNKPLATLTALLTCAFATAALGAGATRLSEPVVVGDGYEVFGAPIEQAGQPQRLAQIIAASEEHTGKEVYATAKVARVCQQKGCFLVAHDGDATARVTFVDYSFFVPTDSGGKDVTIVGTFKRRLVTEAQAKHYAEDVGDDPAEVVGAREEYTIVATSVLLPTL